MSNQAIDFKVKLQLLAAQHPWKERRAMALPTTVAAVTRCQQTTPELSSPTLVMPPLGDAGHQLLAWLPTRRPQRASKCEQHMAVIALVLNRCSFIIFIIFITSIIFIIFIIIIKISLYNEQWQWRIWSYCQKLCLVSHVVPKNVTLYNPRMSWDVLEYLGLLTRP